ncbi:hypothetical protein ACHAXA_008608 [Cyclostephanos tholiformis]|uniref:Uncharacterized protein n=1 Tax=Cyclostephanos tholiformis TaxID=382380 RepID=A0ABD3SP83_9STRA
MSGTNEKVGFLLEIMKARVTTSQAVVCDEVFDEGTAGPLSCGACIADSGARETAGPLSCGACIADSGAREQPVKPLAQPTSHSSSSSSTSKDRLILKGFDFYGNPIRGKDQSAARQVMDNELPTDTLCGDCEALSAFDIREQPPMISVQSYPYSCSQSSASKERFVIKRFDFYGNPVFEQEHQRPSYDQRPTSNLRNFFKQYAKEDYSEFLEVDPTSSPDDADIDQSWIAEFGNCLGVSISELTRLCHVHKESSIAKALREEIKGLRKSSHAIEVDDLTHNYVDINPSYMAELGNYLRFSFMKLTRLCHMGQESSTRESDIINALRDEIRELRKSSKLREVDDLVHEFKLRNDLVNLQLQTKEVEEMYMREIAREIAQKATLKAQLHLRLLKMKEDRMLVETQLSQADSLISQKSELTSTAECTLTNPPAFKLDPPFVKSTIKSPLSKRSGLNVGWEPTISTHSPKAGVLKNSLNELSIPVDSSVKNCIRPEVLLLSPTMFRSPHEPLIQASE